MMIRSRIKGPNELCHSTPLYEFIRWRSMNQCNASLAVTPASSKRWMEGGCRFKSVKLSLTDQVGATDSWKCVSNYIKTPSACGGCYWRLVVGPLTLFRSIFYMPAHSLHTTDTNIHTASIVADSSVSLSCSCFPKVGFYTKRLRSLENH